MTKLKSVLHRTKYALASLAAVATTIASLDLSGIIAVLPPDWATGIAVGFSISAAVAHAAAAIGKSLDSVKTLPVWIFAATATVASLALSSCATSSDAKGNSTSKPDPLVISAIRDIANWWIHKDDEPYSTFPYSNK